MPSDYEVYNGPVCFVDGKHYAVKFDRHGNEVGPDFKKPLFWEDPDAGSLVTSVRGHYRPMEKNDPSHEHVYHAKTVELQVE